MLLTRCAARMASGQICRVHPAVWRRYNDEGRAGHGVTIIRDGNECLQGRGGKRSAAISATALVISVTSEFHI